MNDREKEIKSILKTQVIDAGVQDKSQALDNICNYLCIKYPGSQLEPNLERLGLETTKEVLQVVEQAFKDLRK